MNSADVMYLAAAAVIAVAALIGGVLAGFLVVILGVCGVLRAVWLRANRDAIKDRAAFAARIREVGPR